MLEYDFVFDGDPEEPLISPYEYMVLYNALMGDLEEAIKIKEHMIKKYTKEIVDLKTRIQSIKNAQARAYGRT